MILVKRMNKSPTMIIRAFELIGFVKVLRIVAAKEILHWKNIKK